MYMCNHATWRALQYDIKNRKTFLKRCRYDSITADMLYIGAVVTVYSRQLKLVDYADEFTRKSLSNRQERYLSAVCPDCILHDWLILRLYSLLKRLHWPT